MGSIIDIQGLTKAYGDMRAVDSITFSVKRGEKFGILGPNGAGKTTTLEMVEGLRQPDGGSITIDGIPVWPNPNKTKRLIGVQLQTTALLEFLTVREMVRLFASFYGIQMNRRQSDEVLAEVSLEEKANAMINQLSGGQQQRLSIALALVNDPKILFLDEPTTGLDPQARRKLWSVVERINSEGKTVVLTTHYMEEAEVLCDRIAVMDHGRIIALDTPDNLIRSLNSNAKITFTTRAVIDPGELEQIPTVVEVAQNNGDYTFFAEDVQQSVTALLRFAEKRQVKIEDLNVSGANLEDVFIHMTGRELRS